MESTQLQQGVEKMQANGATGPIGYATTITTAAAAASAAAAKAYHLQSTGRPGPGQRQPGHQSSATKPLHPEHTHHSQAGTEAGVADLDQQIVPRDKERQKTTQSDKRNGRENVPDFEEWKMEVARICQPSPGSSTAARPQVFKLPPRAIKTHFFDSFFTYCHPWSPVVEASWLFDTATQKTPSILLHAVLLAGSCVASRADWLASRGLCAHLKALFFSNQEMPGALRITTCLLMQWWDFSGPDESPADNCNFWLRSGIGTAISMGLHEEDFGHRDASYHRRLWWSLVARDCQFAAAHGWPRILEGRECSVSRLSEKDFLPGARWKLSIEYVVICEIWCSVVEAYRRGEFSRPRHAQLRIDLHAWVKRLPFELRLFHPEPEFGLQAYDFDARQLHLIYFTTLTILCQTPWSTETGTVSAASLLASSFTAAIYEEFIIRDQIRHLGSDIHRFYLRTAGLALLAACRSRALRNEAFKDYAVIKQAAGEFAERYPSTLPCIQTLQASENAQPEAPEPFGRLQPMDEDRVLFEEFGPGLCRQWHLYLDKSQYVL